MSLARVVLLAMLALAAMGMHARAQDDAILRPGDVIGIDLPGEATISRDYQIDRQGRILLPEAGGVALAGQTLSAGSARIRAALSRSFRDLARLSINLKDRRLVLNVHGYVRTPGPVELPGEATIQMAIIAAGGLVPGAQLDRIRVTSATGKRTDFDYKQYLDTGDEKLLPKLQSLDTIFVPASPLIGKVQVEFDPKSLAGDGGGEEGRSVRVFGEVSAPGTFALKPGANIIDILMRAGGVTRFASVEQIRILTRDRPLVFNMQSYLDSGDARLLPTLEAGSTIFVPKQLEEIRRGALTVFVMGEVARPGAFESKEGASFIDIIANSGGPTRFAETRQIRIIRANGEIVHVDLPMFTERGGKLPSVNPGDTIFVPEKTQSSEPSWLKVPPSRAVQVLGAVVKPGRFEWSDEMSLFDLIAAAGGPHARANLSAIQILKNEGSRQTPVVFDMDGFLRNGGPASRVPRIGAGDVVTVPELPVDPSDNKAQWVRQGPENSIYVMGQVAIPGRYNFNHKLGFLDIITAANGPTPAADLRNIRVAKRGQRGAQVINVNLSRYFQTGDEALLPRVRPGDVIYVPSLSRENVDMPSSQTVRLLGAVGKPGRYPFNDSLTLLDLLADAGGPTGDALSDKIVVVHMAGRQKQARVFNLTDFVKTADVSRVPPVRAGDLVYVPRVNESAWKKALEELRDTASAMSILALVNALGFK